MAEVDELFVNFGKLFVKVHTLRLLKIDHGIPVHEPIDVFGGHCIIDDLQLSFDNVKGLFINV